jgi:hypothetical protein
MPLTMQHLLPLQCPHAQVAPVCRQLQQPQTVRIKPTHGLRIAGRFASLRSHLATRNTASGYVAMLPPVHHADQHDLPWLT